MSLYGKTEATTVRVFAAGACDCQCARASCVGDGRNGEGWCSTSGRSLSEEDVGTDSGVAETETETEEEQEQEQGCSMEEDVPTTNV